MFILRQTVGDLIVITLIGDMDMDADVSLRGLFKGSHRDGRPIFVERIPEEDGTTNRAESTPHLLRRLKPCDVFGAMDSQGGTRDVRRNQEMPGLLAALGAVTGVGWV